jgi:hypothetical protein
MRSGVLALALLVAFGGAVADAAHSRHSHDTTSSSARGICYRRAEAVADQAIRYTTEVMVMSDTCRNPTYERFALRQRLELVHFQDLLKEHFRRTGGNAQSKLDTFMTHLANESALRTGIQDINQVCSVAVQFLATADGLSTDGFRRYAESQVSEHGRDYKFCKE